MLWSIGGCGHGHGHALCARGGRVTSLVTSRVSYVTCCVSRYAVSLKMRRLARGCALACPRTASPAARWGHSCGGRQLRRVTALALRLDSQRHLHAGKFHAPARSTCSLCSSGARVHNVRRCERASHLVRFGSGPVALMSPLPCLDLRTRSPSVPGARKRGPDIARDTTDSNTIRTQGCGNQSTF